MTRFACLALLLLAPAPRARADEAMVQVAMDAPAPPPAPRTPLGISGWFGGHLHIGAGHDDSLGLLQVDVLPSIDYSVTMLNDNLRISHRVTYGFRQLEQEASDESTMAQTLRNELGMTIESEVGPYVGARAGFAYTWGLVPDANGRTDRWGPLFGLDAGLDFRIDRAARLGIGLSYTAEPETGGHTVTIGLQGIVRLFDA